MRVLSIGKKSTGIGNIMEKNEETDELIKFESYSVEVQELMGRIPPVILRVELVFIFVLVVVSLALCFLVKVPTTFSFPMELSNTNVLEKVSSKQRGFIMGSVPLRKMAHKGDTLLMMTGCYGMDCDTTYVLAPISGIAYACVPVGEGEIVDKGDLLFFMVDSIKDKMIGKGRVNADLRDVMEKERTVEVQFYGRRLSGKVTSIANYASPFDGSYAIDIEFEIPQDMEKRAVWKQHTEVYVTSREQSVMEKVFPLFKLINNRRK